MVQNYHKLDKLLNVNCCLGALSKALFFMKKRICKLRLSNTLYIFIILYIFCIYFEYNCHTSF